MFKHLLKYVKLLVFILLATNFLKSQENQELLESTKTVSNHHSNKSIILFVVPQYLMLNGIRIDVDFRQKDANKWWMLSPYYYYSNRNSINILRNSRGESAYPEFEYDKLIGVGLGVGRKHFLLKESISTGFYFKYGASYRHFDIQTSIPLFVEYIGDDGLTYQHLEQKPYSLKIENFRLNGEIGYQFETRAQKLFFDFYAGFGASYSFHNSAQENSIEYNRNSIDYGFTGVLLTGGVRIGVAL
ncbi:MAG: hypothetical protein P1P88_18975 [Bacteroidales bacterium]|nr:hypothetical protein [Bacteroidales bacterium]